MSVRERQRVPAWETGRRRACESEGPRARELIIPGKRAGRIAGSRTAVLAIPMDGESGVPGASRPFSGRILPHRRPSLGISRGAGEDRRASLTRPIQILAARWAYWWLRLRRTPYFAVEYGVRKKMADWPKKALAGSGPHP